MNIDVWQMLQDGFHKINWTALAHGFFGFIRDVFVTYPIPCLIVIIIVAFYILYRITKSVERRTAEQARRRKNKQKIRNAKRNPKPKGRHNHRHDRDDEDDDEHNSHRHNKRGN